MKKKKIYLNLDIENRVTLYQDMKPVGSQNGFIEVEVSEDDNFFNQPFFFKYENGRLIFDKDFAEKEIKEDEEYRNRPSTNDQLAALSYQLMNSEFEVSEVKESNANTMYQVMNAEFELSSIKDSNSDLMYQLMLKGVI